MRREELFLTDIIEAVDAIEASLADRALSDFMANPDLRDAVLPRLIKIGEAASRLPATVRQRYTEVPWGDVIGFRNRAVHAYFAIDWAIVGVAATSDAPQVRAQVTDILARDYPSLTPPPRDGPS